MRLKMFHHKKLIMKFTQLLASTGMVLIFSSCLNDPNTLNPIQSLSLHDQQVELHFEPSQSQVKDSSFILSEEQVVVVRELDDMLSMKDRILQARTDSLWPALTRKWTEFSVEHIGTHRTPYAQDETLAKTFFPEAARKWAQLNADLVRLSGEVRFGDALEVLLYSTPQGIFPEDLLKSVIYTHVYDDIYINIIGGSSMEYAHTTGGTVKIIQQTNYPQSDEMTLAVETNDVRYMDVFIRIPSWAVNPSVTHGVVKYVANPGEYCEISKKWRTGDAIKILLRQ